MTEHDLAGRVVVVSPHLDDGVMSLGSALARAARRGAEVEVLTVFAGDPESVEPPSLWDRACGFRSRAEAARARRFEERRACSVIGAVPVPLAFPDEVARGPADEEAVLAAVGARLEAADVVLVPGCPLKHPDHAWLARLLAAHRPAGPRTALYLEQPYAAWAGLRRLPAEPVAALHGHLEARPLEWHLLRRSPTDWARKARALLSFRSQLRGLGRLTPARVLLDEARRGGECVAWLPPLLGRLP